MYKHLNSYCGATIGRYGKYYTEADGAFKTGFVNDEGVLRYVEEGKTAASGAIVIE